MWSTSSLTRLVLLANLLMCIIADLEPIAPSGGAVFRSPKPVGFGVKGIDVMPPQTNGTKEFPFDLTDCDVTDCLMCTKNDKDTCLLCDENSDNPWRLNDGTCGSSCESDDLKVLTADRGYWCIGCLDADERECSQYCSDYRWDATSGNCTDGCQLPSNLGRNVVPGSCTAGETLGASESCEVACTNGAVESLADSLTYSCSSSGSALSVPAAICHTIWDHVKIDDVDLGQRYTALVQDWTDGICDDLHDKTVRATAYKVVDHALSAMGLPNSSWFELHCEASAEFPTGPKFKINSTESFDLIDGKLTIVAPTLTFDKTSGSWEVQMLAESEFTMPDDTSSSVTMQTFALYDTSLRAWELRTGSLGEWESPFGYDWLDNHGVVAATNAAAGEVNSTMNIWANCTLTVGSIEDICSFSYTYTGRSDEPNLVFVEVDEADINTVISLVEDQESLTSTPTLLRDFYLTEPLSLVASDADDVYVDADVGKVDAGLTWFTTMKLSSGSRIHSGLQCLGAQSKYYHFHYFTSDSADNTLEIVHNHAIAANNDWTTTNLAMLGAMDGTLSLAVSARLHVDLAKGVYDFPVVSEYDGSAAMVLSTQLVLVNDTLGYVGVTMHDVYGEFSYNSKDDICDVFLTGDLEFADAGTVAMRGLLSDSAQKHSFWRSTAEVSSVNVGLDIVPWWNEQFPTHEIDDSQLSDLVVTDATISLSTSSSSSVSFPTADDGSTRKTMEFARGYLTSGVQSHLDSGVDVKTELQYAVTSLDAEPSLEVVFDSSALDDFVDSKRSTYTSSAEADFDTPIANLDDNQQQNMSMALQIDYNDDWADTSFTPVVMTAELTNIDLADLAGSSTSTHYLDVKLRVVWGPSTYNFDVPVQYANINDEYVETFLSDIVFQCTEDSDCSNGELCEHAIVAGLLNTTVATWHCVAECARDHFYVNSVGCFPEFGVGDTCKTNLPCGENYCINDKCTVRFENGESCTVNKASHCLSEFCCEGCGNTCQEYPLEPGFNCSVGLEYNECASNWCSSEEGDEDRDAVCLALIEDGETCDEDAHCVSGYCSSIQSDTCITQVNVSESCYLDDDCMSGLTCCWECGFICETYPRDLGVSCIQDSDCESEFCSSASFTCSQIVGDGEECEGDDGCTSGFCHPDRGVCYSTLDDGESCSYDDDCTSGYCSSDQGDTCFTLLNDDEACDYDSDCSSGWCTVHDSAYADTTAGTTSCQSKYTKGATCSGDDQCKSGDCSADCVWFVCECA